MTVDKTLDRVGEWYSNALKEHGTDARGVGWTNKERHQLRFKQLSQVCIDEQAPFTVNDLGCGYGALYDYLQKEGKLVSSYNGYDISQDMLDSTKDRLPSDHVTLYHDKVLKTKADYSFASGIFNVRFDTTEQKWESYIKDTLKNMNDYSEKGFSFNMLTSNVDWKEDNLYYADPCYFFKFCQKNFSRKIALLHDTELYEWTMVVRK